MEIVKSTALIGLYAPERTGTLAAPHAFVKLYDLCLDVIHPWALSATAALTSAICCN